MSKMTDKEIKQALECCIKSSNFGECFENKCPFVSENGCKVGKETLYPYVLDLINRQQTEIEKLNNNISAMAITLSNSAKETRAEAIKEFAERFEAYIPNIEAETTMECVKNAIKQTLKEMVGEGK